MNTGALAEPLYYRCHVFCCVNERPEAHERGSCARRGSVRLRNYMKARAKELGLDDVRINASGCLDRCELGPTMVIYPDAVWYRYETRADVDEILQTHVVHGRPVERLMLRAARTGPFARRNRPEGMPTAGDTIFAPATADGRAGIAVIRISGPGSFEGLARVTGRTSWIPRRATGVRLRGRDREVFDHGLGLWFPAPSSFTGEDVAELHVHGGRAVLAAALEALGAIEGFRPAEPGEFTRRAFENGKLDLTQAEALADLVGAETAEQRRQALAQLEGGLGRLYDSWRDRLIRAMARQEAMIDFSDEDLPEGLTEISRAEVAEVHREVRVHLADDGRGERIRDGVSVVLVGPPNAGKSSLLNALARREAAIVDAAPGTTRDVIEVPMDLAGMRVVFADTAGLREVEGSVEREGVRRSFMRAERADIRIAVFDGALWPSFDVKTADLLDAGTVVVVNKGDLDRVRHPARIRGRDGLVVSALTGEGMPMLLRSLTERVGAACAGGDGPALTRIRHRRELEKCSAALRRYGMSAGGELAAEELRLALSALGRITGRVDVEDVLGAIFQEFCIGK